MNNKILVGSVLSTMLFFSMPASSDEFLNGFKAAEQHDYKVAVQKWERLAKRGDPNAQFMLGMMYHSGIAGEQDEVAAVNLYKKAAEGGNLVAQEYLAIAYKEGWFGLKVNKKQAKYWENKVRMAGDFR